MLECPFAPIGVRTLRDPLMEVDSEMLPQRTSRLLVEHEYTAGTVVRLAYETVTFWKSFD